MAAQLYDDILFNGATYADLKRGNGPLIMVMTTDLSSGSRFGYVQPQFDVICSDLTAVPLSRAAATSSAVPIVLSPVTLNNYGGTCGYKFPAWMVAAADPNNPARPAARALKRMEEMESFANGKDRPFLHLVDGGLADNLGMRAVLEVLEEFEALRMRGIKTPLDNVKRIVVVVVNSLSVPKNTWDQSERPPGTFEILIKATGVPIDRYSFETVELMRDMIARWDLMRRIRESPALDAAKDPSLAARPARAVHAALRDRRVVPAAQGRRPSSPTSTTCRRRSCCRPRRSTGCARRPGRSCSTRPTSSSC